MHIINSYFVVQEYHIGLDSKNQIIKAKLFHKSTTIFLLFVIQFVNVFLQY